MRKDIGSDYHILKSDVDGVTVKKMHYDLLNGFERDTHFLSTCRSAIAWILSNEITPKNKKVLLPGFTCHSVLEPCEKEGYEVYPYPVTSQLTVNWTEFREVVNFIDPGVVILHAYFGFNTIQGCDGIIDSLHERGIVVIEDRTQCVFSKFKTNADFVVGSIRKWLPVPDGAFIIGSNKINHLQEDGVLCEAKLKALNAKADYIVNEVGDSSLFRPLFFEAEEILDSRNEPFEMHYTSKAIYQNTDLANLKKTRVNNYNALSARLAKHGELDVIIKEADETVAPFHLPVLVNGDRRSLQAHLAKNGVFATVIWACPEEFIGKINEGAQTLFDKILCFHCDQRYTIDDMNRIGDVIDEYYLNK